MRAEELGDRPPQLAGAVAVNDAQRAQIVSRRIVEETLDPPDSFLRIRADHIDATTDCGEKEMFCAFQQRVLEFSFGGRTGGQ